MPAILRRILLSPGEPPSLSQLAATFPSLPSSPSYITFCSRDGILVVEKDLNTAVIHSSSDFLAVTNHDVQIESWSPEHWSATLKQGPGLMGIDTLLEDSVERKECITRMFRESSLGRSPRFEDVKAWITTEPLLNGATHFSCIMDPGTEGGGLVWACAYETPADIDEDEGSSFE